MNHLPNTLIGGVCVSVLVFLGCWAWLRAATGVRGFRAAQFPGAALGFLAGRVARVRRGHVRAALRHAQIPEETADAMYAQLGRGVFELLWLSLPGRRELEPVVAISEDLAPWLSSERGVVVATAHTANWDLAACAVAQRIRSRPPGSRSARKMLVVTKHFSLGWLDRVWQRLRGRYGVTLVSAGAVWRSAREELPRGSAICMIIDQAPERQRSTLRMPFLGRDCDVDLAPALLAARLRVPLIGVFPERLPDGCLRLDLAVHCAVPSKANRKWVERSTRLLTQALEDAVRQRPAQWLWMHRRWKAPPVAAGVASEREHALTERGAPHCAMDQTSAALAEQCGSAPAVIQGGP